MRFRTIDDFVGLFILIATFVVGGLIGYDKGGIVGVLISLIPSAIILSLIISVLNWAMENFDFLKEEENPTMSAEETETFLKNVFNRVYGVNGEAKFDELFSNKTKDQQTENNTHSSQSGKSSQSETTTQNNSYKEYFAILESKPTDSFETIKRNYYRLAKEYHPDHLGANASESIKLIAKEKAQKINEAYQYIKKIKGVK